MNDGHWTEQVPVRPLEQKPRIFLVRNGEPCDRLTKAWAYKAFHEVDKYNFLDQNQPLSVINRTALAKSSMDEAADLFKNDTALTQIGRLCARRVGAAMYQRNVQFHVVFCSPALRCVETATAILSKIPTKKAVKFLIEPGLLDPLMFYQKETVAEYQMRITTVVQHITKAAKRSDSSVLVVTHAPSIDLIARKLIGREDFPKTPHELNRMSLFYPFVSVTALQNVEYGEDGTHSKWTLQRQAIPPMTLGHVNTTAHMPSL